METQLKNLEDELRLRNFSKKTIKSYIFETEKFLKFSQNKRLIQKPLGHSDIETTQIYLKISNVSIKNIKSSLDNL